MDLRGEGGPFPLKTPVHSTPFVLGVLFRDLLLPPEVRVGTGLPSGRILGGPVSHDTDTSLAPDAGRTHSTEGVSCPLSSGYCPFTDLGPVLRPRPPPSHPRPRAPSCGHRRLTHVCVGPLWSALCIVLISRHPSGGRLLPCSVSRSDLWDRCSRPWSRTDLHPPFGVESVVSGGPARGSTGTLPCAASSGSLRGGPSTGSVSYSPRAGGHAAQTFPPTVANGRHELHEHLRRSLLVPPVAHHGPRLLVVAVRVRVWVFPVPGPPPRSPSPAGLRYVGGVESVVVCL